MIDSLPLLRTDRLKLVPLSPELLALALTNATQFATRLSVTAVDDWLRPDTREALQLFSEGLGAGCFPDMGCYLLVEVEFASLIGDIVLRDVQDTSGALEIGYFLVQAWRKRGYASEAAGAVMAWARTQPRVRRIVARCEFDNEPSARTARRIGMTWFRQAGNTITWELNCRANCEGTPGQDKGP